jgi:hypothetical protein
MNKLSYFKSMAEVNRKLGNYAGEAFCLKMIEKYSKKEESEEDDGSY